MRAQLDALESVLAARQTDLDAAQTVLDEQYTELASLRAQIETVRQPLPSEEVYVHACDAEALIERVDNVDLFLIDPPYHILSNAEASWDNQWKSEEDYVAWLVDLVRKASAKLAPHGSFIIFQGFGKHGAHPMFDVIKRVEEFLTFRNVITWAKRRGYGKSHDYLYLREEILWFSKSDERTNLHFHIPLTDELRGYKGFNKNYAAKSDFKRVGNVFKDLSELFRTERVAQKPIPLIDRLIETHSNEGDLVCDFFSGWGTTGVSAIKNNRRFIGCEAIPEDAAKANERCLTEANRRLI